MLDLLLTLGFTALALAAVWWTVLRLPRFWRSPRKVDFDQLPFSPERQARGLPAAAVLGAPLLVVMAAALWLDDDDRDGVAEWLQAVLGYWIMVVVVVPLVVAGLGRPRFAVPPSLRGELRDSPIHDVTVSELVGAGDQAFFATCTCGWDTDHRATEWEVRSEAEQHTSQVRPELERIGGSERA